MAVSSANKVSDEPRTKPEKEDINKLSLLRKIHPNPVLIRDP